MARVLSQFMSDAATKGDVAELRTLLEAGTDIDIKVSATQATALIYAAVNGRMEAVSFLLERGASVYEADMFKRTALHWAAHVGHEDMVRALLRAGASPDATEMDDMTPEDVASSKGFQEVEQILRDWSREQGRNGDSDPDPEKVRKHSLVASKNAKNFLFYVQARRLLPAKQAELDVALTLSRQTEAVKRQLEIYRVTKSTFPH